MREGDDANGATP